MAICVLKPSDAPDVHAVFQAAVSGRSHVGPAWGLEQVEEELRDGLGIAFRGPSGLDAYILYRLAGEVRDITHLATRPESQRWGLMSQLINALKADLPVGGEIWLEVHEHNPVAQSLYRKLNFTQVGRRAAYYTDGAAALLFQFLRVS